MTDPLFGHTRDTGTDDPGCDAAFEALDRYIEALLRGDDVTATYADVVTHLRNCSACREDAEGLLAALRELEHPSPDQT